MKRLPLTVALLLLLTLAVSAQVPAVSYTFRIYNRGATAPLTTPMVIQVASLACGQPATVNASTANPNKLEWDDPSAPGKVCRYTDPGTGPLLALPSVPGTYEGTLSATVDGQEGPESNRAPFVKAPPIVNFKVVR